MKILNWIINFISKTFGTWHWPWVDKQFPIQDYFEIEKRIRELEVPFAVGLVKTNGHGSNILIKIGQGLSKDKRNRKCNIVHALAHIGLYGGYKHRVVEAIGDGIREVPLLQAVGQRDVVIIRTPNWSKLNPVVCKYAIEYLKDLADRDKEKNIAYDNAHDYYNAEALDCSETVYRALEYGFKKADQVLSISLINRGGKMTWTPADIRFSDLFIDMYVSGEGFKNG